MKGKNALVIQPTGSGKSLHTILTIPYLHFVGGIFSLNNKGTYCVRVHSFSP